MKLPFSAEKKETTLSFHSRLFLMISFLFLLGNAAFAQNETFKPAATDNDSAVVYLNAATLITNTKEMQAARTANLNFAGKQMRIIQFRGAIQPSWYNILTAAGAEIVDYIPNNAYIILTNSSSLQQINSEAQKAGNVIRWDGEYLPGYRLSPDVYGNGPKGQTNGGTISAGRFSVQLFANESLNVETISLLKKNQPAGAAISRQAILHYVNLVVTLSPETLQALIQRPDVISVHRYIEPKKNDEAQDIIMTGQLTGSIPTPGNYLTYLTGKGFTQAQFDASAFVVNVTDGGLDSGSVGNVLNPTAHFALYKNGDKAQPTRVAFSHKQGTATDADTKGCEGHGNINTHIIGGYVPNSVIGNANHSDANNFRYGLGVAPFVRVGNSTIFNASDSYTNPTLANIEAESYRDGGRISSNSWGASSAGAYTTDAQAYDALVRDAQPAASSVPVAGNQEMVIVFSAGNDGSAVKTIGSPGTGKNVITVGASENVRAFGGADGCGTTDAEANSAFDIVGFSSRGPTTDGRIKPDIMAPGTHITGGVYQSNAAFVLTGVGSAASCFAGNGVCGGLGTADFFPGSQRWTTASSGTSHSCPAIAGFAALVRQDFINRSLTPPSPAMTKAMILNSGGYMNGTGANDNLFSSNQGMGLVNMNNYFTAITNPNILKDEVAADMFTSSGQSKTFTGTIADNTKPFRVTLAYTDAPGSTTGNSYVNNLDLEVTAGGTTYKGNVFTGANSVAGGTADAKNNVESVFIPAGVSGPISVKITATNIAGDGVPNVGTALDQDYALIITNVNQTTTAAASSTGASITAETCGTGLIADPGEPLTVDLPITNSGTANATNIVATLQANADVTSPSGSQSYGALAIGATATKSFTFTVSSATPCGATFTLTFNVTDGATNLGTVTKTFTTGTPTILTGQNFDGVVAPALPAGWTNTLLSGTTINWVTSTTGPNSSPNAAFANDPATVNSAALISPAFTPVSSSTLSFQKAYTTESTYDGVVLDISINGGAYTDIITAGGSFITGGYTATLNTGFGNTLPGRAAWSGTFASFTQTQVSFPASAIGQSVRLRWVMGSDNAVSSTGFRLDDVSVTGANACSPCLVTLNLLSFTGSKQTGYNLLQWKTVDEDTHAFDLEYSTDGTNFTKGYSIAAGGSGNHEYLQKDNGPRIKGIVYYRLRIFAKDGRQSYSNVVTLRNNSTVELPAALFPNPAKDEVTLTIGDRSLIGTKAALYDVTGKQMKSFPIDYNSTKIDLQRYSSGDYFIRLADGQTLRLIKR